MPRNPFSRHSFSGGQKGNWRNALLPPRPISYGFRAGAPGSQILKTSDTHMRLLRAFIDWIYHKRQPEQETLQHSADDPWVLQQIEKFERELKR